MSSGSVPPTHTHCLPRRSLRGPGLPRPDMHLPLPCPSLRCLSPLLLRPLWLPHFLRSGDGAREVEGGRGLRNGNSMAQKGPQTQMAACQVVLTCPWRRKDSPKEPNPSSLCRIASCFLLSDLQCLVRVQDAGWCSEVSRAPTWDQNAPELCPSCSTDDMASRQLAKHLVVSLRNRRGKIMSKHIVA